MFNVWNIENVEKCAECHIEKAPRRKFTMELLLDSVFGT